MLKKSLAPSRGLVLAPFASTIRLADRGSGVELVELVDQVEPLDDVDTPVPFALVPSDATPPARWNEAPADWSAVGPHPRLAELEDLCSTCGEPQGDHLVTPDGAPGRDESGLPRWYSVEGHRFVGKASKGGAL